MISQTNILHQPRPMCQRQWSASTARECCLEILPRKVTAQIGYFDAVAPVLREFFAFLDENRLLPQAATLAKALTGLDQEIVAAASDRSSWGPAKSFMMAALDDGADVHNEEAVSRYMLQFNERLQATRSLAPPPENTEPMSGSPPPTIDCLFAGPNPKLGAMIHARAAAARNTRSAVERKSRLDGSSRERVKASVAKLWREL